MKTCPKCQTQFAGGEVFCPLDGARLTSPSQVAVPISDESGDPLIGTVLENRYQIVRRIGEGGMGIVYEAIHTTIEKRVALKVLRDDFSSKPDVVKRFHLEAKSASRIGHEHIVDISDFGVTPQRQSFFVMEMLDGQDLADVLARERTLPFKRAAKIVIQCCKALGAAHAKGIVHRDMKPENIFLVRRDDDVDFVKIVDFGIAKMNEEETPGVPGKKLTKTGMIFGTPEYMSPEQAAGKQLDHRVDVYAMGIILYELLTGRVPFVGDTFMGVLTQHMFETPQPLRAVNPSLEVTPAIEGVIFKALAKSAQDRYQSMDELARALASVSDATGPIATGGSGMAPLPRLPSVRPAAPSDRAQTLVGYVDQEPPPPSSSSRLTVISIVLGILLVGGGLGLAFMPGPGNAGDGTTALANDGAGGGSTTKQTDVAVDAAAGAVVEPVAVVDAGTPVVAQPVMVDAGPATVTLRIETTPSGAEITIAGRGRVCEETPCDVVVARGEPLRISARKGAMRGSQTISLQADQSIGIVLAGSSKQGGRPPNGGGRHPDDDLHRPDWANAP